MCAGIVPGSISVFEAMNRVRNEMSFAHDNPDLAEMEVARLIIESVVALLRHAKAIDRRYFGGRVPIQRLAKRACVLAWRRSARCPTLPRPLPSG